ncbi:MAG: hypothetical protein ACW97A_07900 [Candidatus Thorarchaeota archaeon]|jgi:hypothetical protein
MRFWQAFGVFGIVLVAFGLGPNLLKVVIMPDLQIPYFLWGYDIFIGFGGFLILIHSARQIDQDGKLLAMVGASYLILFMITLIIMISPIRVTFSIEGAAVIALGFLAPVALGIPTLLGALYKKMYQNEEWYKTGKKETPDPEWLVE